MGIRDGLKSNGGLVIDNTELAVNVGASEISGTLPVSKGGTGQTSYTNSQLLIGNTYDNTLAKATLTAGTNVSITNGGGSITIASTDTNTNQFSYLYDGRLNFHEDYYIAEYTKNYFKNGGAFWYSAKRDYNNNIIKLLDLKTNFSSCEEADNFSLTGNLYEFILKSNKLQFCVER